MSFAVGILVGVVLGALLSAGGFWYLNRTTTVVTAKDTITLDGGIVLPKGTQLVHDRSMSEGFETLHLYVNVPTVGLPQHFEQRSEQRAFLVIPYWIRD